MEIWVEFYGVRTNCDLPCSVLNHEMLNGSSSWGSVMMWWGFKKVLK